MAEAHVSSDHWLVAAGVAGPAMARAGKGGWEAYSHPLVMVGAARETWGQPSQNCITCEFARGFLSMPGFAFGLRLRSLSHAVTRLYGPACQGGFLGAVLTWRRMSGFAKGYDATSEK